MPPAPLGETISYGLSECLEPEAWNSRPQVGFVALPAESVYCMNAPTFIKTPGTAECLGDPAFRADVLERIAALHRIGEPMDVAGAVVFLASPAASLITGQTLMIDGGWTAR